MNGFTRTLSIFGCLAVALVAAWARAEGTALQEADLDIDRLRRWGSREFLYQVERGGEQTVLGTVTMRTDMRDDRVEIDDRWEVDWRDRKIKVELKLDCRRDNLLRPTSIQSKGEGDDEVGTFTVEVGKDKATVRADEGGTRTIDFPADTLTDVAMFRVFTLLPRAAGATVSVGHVMEVSELNLKGAATIAYQGLDEINLHGKPTKLHKFAYARDGRTVAEAWVDSDHILRQLRIDGRKVLTENFSRERCNLRESKGKSVETKVAMAINTFKSEFRKGEPVKLAVALANSGTETLYVPAMEALGITLVNTQGKEVPVGPIPDPPPPPPEHYVEQDGERVLMEPVWALAPGEGKVFIVPDVLKYYHVKMIEGKYAFHFPFTYLPARREKDVVVRDGLYERLWVPAGPVKDKVQISPSNRVEVSIAPMLRNGKDAIGHSQPAFVLQYLCWSGTSPGAGFTSTSLHVVEVDLNSKRLRRLRKRAQAPEPMLPHDKKGITRLMRTVDWKDLSSAHVDKIRELTSAWIGSEPPPRYNDPKGLGGEDGYLERLCVTWGTDSLTTEINPRGGFSPNDPLRPTREWIALIEMISDQNLGATTPTTGAGQALESTPRDFAGDTVADPAEDGKSGTVGSQPPKFVWGHPHGGVRLGLRAERVPGAGMDLYTFVVAAENITKRPLKIAWGDYGAGPQHPVFIIFDKTGADKGCVIPPHAHGRPDPHNPLPPFPMELRPGKITLLYTTTFVPPLGSGDYRLYARVNPHMPAAPPFDNEAWRKKVLEETYASLTGRLESGVVSLKIRGIDRPTAGTESSPTR